MTTVANPAANAQTPQARRERLRDLIPLVMTWVIAGDVFTDEGARRLACATRWRERNDLTGHAPPAGDRWLDADWRLYCDLVAADVA